jgi:hypothetical protein
MYDMGRFRKCTQNIYRKYMERDIMEDNAYKTYNTGRIVREVG